MREVEFRPGFLSGFVRHANAIPPQFTEAELATELGFPSVEEMSEYLKELRAPSIPPEERNLNDVEDIPF